MYVQESSFSIFKSLFVAFNNTDSDKVNNQR